MVQCVNKPFSISDLWQMLVTMPLTLVEIRNSFWTWSLQPFLCKSIPVLQAVSVFNSTLFVTAITLDRWALCQSTTPYEDIKFF